jgi:heterogeneous nuclear ribonucleoprotein K
VAIINFVVLIASTRLLLISGDIDTCISALLDVIPLVEDNQKFNNTERDATELRLLVHQSQAGCIIGRGGDKIKELRIVTKTAIFVLSLSSLFNQ